jgi:hypothetical protein
MQRVGCDRIHEVETLHAEPHRGDHHPKGADAQTALDYRPRINNGGYSAAEIAVEAQRGVDLIRKPAKLTGNSQERAMYMYMGGAHQNWCG